MFEFFLSMLIFSALTSITNIASVRPHIATWTIKGLTTYCSEFINNLFPIRNFYCFTGILVSIFKADLLANLFVSSKNKTNLLFQKIWTLCKKIYNLIEYSKVQFKTWISNFYILLTVKWKSWKKRMSKKEKYVVALDEKRLLTAWLHRSPEKLNVASLSLFSSQSTKDRKNDKHLFTLHKTAHKLPE